ncbi:MAG: DUF2914 domain-containing protein [Deltaproteobacteria bacterium]|nr:DUF2914 domain-containing protein [Deltaproteobacteria bacterium]MCW8891796.1 DUF2914 domain-containing protein [Deltaproteobacteria bacterium]MCW9049811.1 DUF2914 domain-containing protein [Deltaproteobacteria bacterium]
MLKKMFIVFVLAMLSISVGYAAELRVTEEAITSAVENQMPVDRIETYRADYGKLYCFTRIAGAQEDTEITHVWYYQDDEMARVTLPIRSSDWRTYSSKRFLPQWAGDWKVVVLDAGLNEIATIPFRLE